MPRSAHLSEMALINRATINAKMIGKIVGPKALAILILVPNSDIGCSSRVRAQAPKTNTVRVSGYHREIANGSGNRDVTGKE